MGNLKVKAALALLACLSCVLVGCGGSGGSASGSTGSEGGGAAQDTSGPAYELPASINAADYAGSIATADGEAFIDASNAALGYVGASAVSPSRLKFQVIKDGTSYNYDMEGDGTPLICPLNMGDGSYEFRIMENTSGNNYVELLGDSAAVTLQSEFEPFLRPNVFCQFTNDSACVAQARLLAAHAQNEGEVVKVIYDWLVENITYDKSKAAELATTTGYIPIPDETFSSKTGICFDYASLAAAMFRSLNIPCQIITGYVSPDNIYHAWNMIYIDGKWVGAHITVDPDQWTRIDVTFAAGGADTSQVGDGSAYTDRYVY